MSLQARLSENDPRLYNSYRDVAHCFGDVMREVAARLEDRRWPELDAILTKEGITMDQLGDACAAACTFVQTATELPKEKMHEALERSGWWKVPAPAQMALCAMIGTVMFGYFYAGVREATLGGQGPCQTFQDLRAFGSHAQALLSMGPWKRRWVRFTLRLEATWKALRGR